ncbi:helix-turn-helix transcriptional regulator [Saccharopolyspora sp. NPDC047091]|uniref:helix-turn-helix domain-containing protein n=1 Tax=Saccharopolyspora sp. NPDC047091 TaxID=3155924 RepID=UPI0033E20E75
MLRKQRIAAGLSAAELARSVGMSGSKISRFENCESGIYLDDLEKLIDFYGMSKKRRVELLDIARHAEERGWLRMNHPSVSEDWRTWADFESEASALLNYEPLVIPGLLQTPEYAKHVIAATGGGLNSGHEDLLVASRRARQAVLDRATPLEMHAVIEESVLQRRGLPDGVMAQQARHLTEVATKTNVQVQIMPQAAGLHEGVSGSFAILKYDDEPSLILLEHKLTSLFLDEDDHIQAYSEVWRDLVSKAWTVEESVDYVRAMA